MISVYLLQYLFLLTTLILVNFIGKIALSVLNINPEKKFYRLFLELVSGLIIIVFLYSVISTRFLTVNLLFLFLFLYYYFVFDTRKIRLPGLKKLGQTFHHVYKDIFILALCCLPFFLFEFYYLYSSSGIKIPCNDFFYYADISNSLNLSGRENRFLSLNVLYPEQYNVMVTYHYFELWLNAFVSKLFHSPSIFSLLLITFPALNCVVYIGLVAIWETYYKVSFLSLSIIFFLFFTDGVYLPFYDNLPLGPDYRSTLQTSLFTVWGKKFSSEYMFVVLFILLYLKDRKIAAFIALSSLIIISVGMTPGVFMGVFAFLLLNRFHRTFSAKDTWKILLFYTIIPLFFYLIYFVLGTSSKFTDYVSDNNFMKTILSDYSNISHYKYLYGMMMYRFIRSFFIYLPYIIFSVVIYKTLIKHNKDLTILIILVLLCNFAALLSYGFAIGLTNSGQLFSNTFSLSTSLLNIIIMFGLIKLIQLKYSIKKLLFSVSFIIIFILNGVNIYNNNKLLRIFFAESYSTNYTDNVISETANQPFILYAILLSNKNIKDMLSGGGFNKPGNTIKLNYGYKGELCLNLDIFFDSTESINSVGKSFNKNSEFYLFTNNQKQLGLFKTYEQSQLDFIDKYHIKYLFADKDAYISELIKKRVHKEIVDSISGEQFYILK